MRKQRLFVAIELPAEIGDALELVVEELRTAHRGTMRFLPRDLWHITLLFLGYCEVRFIDSILTAVGETAKAFSAPRIQFEALGFGPPERSRMIWLSGTRETSDTLRHIHDHLADRLREAQVPFAHTLSVFRAHVTVARPLRNSVISREAIDVHFPRSYTPTHLSLVESRPRRTGSQYETIAAFAFR